MQTTDAKPLTRSEKKRADILSAASAEFQARGFTGASMDGISAAAGVSKRTLYNHFANKEALFEAITDQLFQVCGGTQYQADVALEQQLWRMAEAKLELLAEPGHIALARSLIGETMRSPELAQRAMARFERNEDGVTGWFKAAIEDGKLAGAEPYWMAHQFFGLVKTFAFFPQLMAHQPMPDEATQKRIIDSSVSMILASYRVS
ncbi:TetR/AcrR family transcriptional regulator [Ferrimonas marina]|uniref:Transcriptional regulator, TetR family n=1 Tax=Ferrimonas marina TaxID=299255 RepID=A0A1M5YGQ8_9GAMM|nr:TetR/AcrR family transcriptional regulator [Ferrimonas marina]SHI11251.1 transcriptional regulator, TetR family [Ferrimonas marina]